MQRIALADEYFDLVRKGIKTSTVRFKKRDYVGGETEFYSETSDNTVKINVKTVVYKTMEELSEIDAIQDGFKSLGELKEALKRFYPLATDSDIITKVVFEYVGN